MTQRPSDTADRILREALKLFASVGYERTTVADIQAAVGLRPGSGALYRHFPSKEAVLRAAVERFIGDAAQARELLRQLPAEPPAALALLGRAGMAPEEEGMQMLQVVWRELQAFPDLRDQVVQERMDRTQEAVARWLAGQAERGGLAVDDPQAMAAVLLSGIRVYRVTEALLGAPPGGIDADRYLRAWTALVTRGLAPDHPADDHPADDLSPDDLSPDDLSPGGLPADAPPLDDPAR